LKPGGFKLWVNWIQLVQSLAQSLAQTLVQTRVQPHRVDEHSPRGLVAVDHVPAVQHGRGGDAVLREDTRRDVAVQVDEFESKGAWNQDVTFQVPRVETRISHFRFQGLKPGAF
jgi:hypothetical protein